MVSGSDSRSHANAMQKGRKINDANERFKPILGMVLTTPKDHAASNHD